MAKFTRDSIIDLVGSKVEAFNKQYNLFEKTDEILVACSGNADSVFAVHYLIKNKYKIGIAHVDHLTRNGQSTKDANFVENLAKKLNIPFHLKTINIKELISEKGNFQEVARKERYQFFSDIIQSHNYSKILTAHHGDDNVENVLMNLGRAGGIKALRGILPKNNALIRPFLILRKHEILAYLELNELDYTEDSSNSESDYKRNYFRNKVLPVIENKQSNWVDQAMKSAEYMLDIENELNYLANKLLTVNSNLHSISLNALLEQGNPNLYLFFILSSYGFNKAQVDEILKSNKVGKKWENHDYILFKERNCIEFFKKLIIKKEQSYPLGIELPRVGVLSFDQVKKGVRRIIIPESIEERDLIIRIKQDGDFVQFKNTKKKLKKIFNEYKWTNYQKLTSFVVAKGSEIYWIENIKL